MASEASVYRITVSAMYSGSKPVSLRVRQKENSSGTITYNFLYAEETENTAALTVCGIKTLGVGGEFEIFAKYATESSNQFFVLVEKLG